MVKLFKKIGLIGSSKFEDRINEVNQYIKEVSTRDSSYDIMLKSDSQVKHKKNEYLDRVANLTEELEARERKLINITNKWRGMIDLITDIIFVVNEDGLIREYNREFLNNIKNVSSDDIKKLHCFDILKGSLHHNKEHCPLHNDNFNDKEQININNEYLCGTFLLSIHKVKYLSNGDRINCLVILRNIEDYKIKNNTKRVDKSSKEQKNVKEKTIKPSSLSE